MSRSAAAEGAPKRASVVGLMLAAAALAAGLLVLAAGPADAAFPGANGKIIFQSDRTMGEGVDNPTADTELFTMNPNGTGTTQITNNTVYELWPAFSRDGGWIAFNISDDIYMRTLGGNLFLQFPLTSNGFINEGAAFSPDGGRVAFLSIRGTNPDVYSMRTADNDPADGNGDDLTNLSNNPASDRDPAWSPNGAKIAFSTDRDQNGEIYVMDRDGTDQVNLTKRPGADDRDPNWAPGGRRIVFASARKGNLDIYVMNRDGSGQKRLTTNAAMDHDPAFSPDGKKIAFVSRRGEGNDEEIFVMNADGSRQRNLTNNTTPDQAPDWQPVP